MSIGFNKNDNIIICDEDIYSDRYKIYSINPTVSGVSDLSIYGASGAITVSGAISRDIYSGSPTFLTEHNVLRPIVSGPFYFKVENHTEYSHVSGAFTKNDLTPSPLDLTQFKLDFDSIINDRYTVSGCWNNTRNIFTTLSANEEIMLTVNRIVWKPYTYTYNGKKIKPYSEYPELNIKIITISNLLKKEIIKQFSVIRGISTKDSYNDNYYLSGDGKFFIKMSSTTLDFYSDLDNFETIIYSKNILEGTFNKKLYLKLPYRLKVFPVCINKNSTNYINIYFIDENTEINVMETPDSVYGITMSLSGTVLIISTISDSSPQDLKEVSLATGISMSEYQNNRVSNINTLTTTFTTSYVDRNVNAISFTTITSNNIFIYEWNPYEKKYNQKTKITNKTKKTEKQQTIYYIADMPIVDNIPPKYILITKTIVTKIGFSYQDISLSNSGILGVYEPLSLMLVPINYAYNLSNSSIKIYKNDTEVICQIETLPGATDPSIPPGYEIKLYNSVSGSTVSGSNYIYLTDYSHKYNVDNEFIQNIYGITDVDGISYNNTTTYKKLLEIDASVDSHYIKQNKAIASFLKSNIDNNKKVTYNIPANDPQVIEYFSEILPYNNFDKVNPQFSFLNNTIKYKVGYESLLKNYSYVKDRVQGWLSGTINKVDVKNIDYTNINMILNDLTLNKSYQDLETEFNYYQYPELYTEKLEEEIDISDELKEYLKYHIKISIDTNPSIDFFIYTFIYDHFSKLNAYAMILQKLTLQTDLTTFSPIVDKIKNSIGETIEYINTFSTEFLNFPQEVQDHYIRINFSKNNNYNLRNLVSSDIIENKDNPNTFYCKSSKFIKEFTLLVNENADSLKNSNTIEIDDNNKWIVSSLHTFMSYDTINNISSIENDNDDNPVISNLLEIYMSNSNNYLYIVKEYLTILNDGLQKELNNSFYELIINELDKYINNSSIEKTYGNYNFINYYDYSSFQSIYSTELISLKTKESVYTNKLYYEIIKEQSTTTTTTNKHSSIHNNIISATNMENLKIMLKIFKSKYSIEIENTIELYNSIDSIENYIYYSNNEITEILPSEKVYSGQKSYIKKFLDENGLDDDISPIIEMYKEKLLKIKNVKEKLVKLNIETDIITVECKDAKDKKIGKFILDVVVGIALIAVTIMFPGVGVAIGAIVAGFAFSYVSDEYIFNCDNETINKSYKNMIGYQAEIIPFLTDYTKQKMPFVSIIENISDIADYLNSIEVLYDNQSSGAFAVIMSTAIYNKIHPELKQLFTPYISKGLVSIMKELFGSSQPVAKNSRMLQPYVQNRINQLLGYNSQPVAKNSRMLQPYVQNRINQLLGYNSQPVNSQPVNSQPVVKKPVVKKPGIQRGIQARINKLLGLEIAKQNGYTSGYTSGYSRSIGSDVIVEVKSNTISNNKLVRLPNNTNNTNTGLLSRGQTVNPFRNIRVRFFDERLIKIFVQSLISQQILKMPGGNTLETLLRKYTNEMNKYYTITRTPSLPSPSLPSPTPPSKFSIGIKSSNVLKSFKGTSVGTSVSNIGGKTLRGALFLTGVGIGAYELIESLDYYDSIISVCDMSKLAQNLLITELTKEETLYEYFLNNIQLNDKINIYENESNIEDDFWFLWEKFYETVDFNNQNYNYNFTNENVKKDISYYNKYRLLSELNSVLSLYEYYLMINPYEDQLSICYSRIEKLYESIIDKDTDTNIDDSFIDDFKNMFGNVETFKNNISLYLTLIKNKQTKNESFDNEILSIKSIISSKELKVRLFKETVYKKISTYDFSYGDGYYEKIKKLTVSGAQSVSGAQTGIDIFDYSRLETDKTFLQSFKDGLISKTQDQLNNIMNDIPQDIITIKKNISTVEIDKSDEVATVAYNKNNTNYLNYLYPYINYLIEMIETLQEKYKTMYLLQKTTENSIKLNITPDDMSKMTDLIKLFYEIINDKEVSDNIDVRYRKTIDYVLKGKSVHKTEIIQINNILEIDNIDITPIGHFRKQSEGVTFSLNPTFKITMDSIHIDNDILTLKLNINTIKNYIIVIRDYNNMEIYSSVINTSTIIGTVATKFIPISVFTTFKTSYTVYASDNISDNNQIYHKCFSFILNDLYLKSLSFEYARSDTQLVETTIKLDSTLIDNTLIDNTLIDNTLYTNLIPVGLTSENSPSPYIAKSESTRDAFKVFNGVKGKTTDNVIWYSSKYGYYDGLDFTANMFTSTTTVNGSDIRGDWIEIGNTATQFDNVKEVVLYGSSIQSFPKRIMVVGSNDGITWNKMMDSQEFLGDVLGYIEDDQYITNSQRLIINHISNYKYIRLIIRQIRATVFEGLVEVEYKKLQPQTQTATSSSSQTATSSSAQTATSSSAQIQ